MKPKQFIRLALVLIAFFMVFNIFSDVWTTIQVKSQIKQAKHDNHELNQEKDSLEKEIIKLNDDKYLEAYVSGTIFSTEKGMSVYVLPKEED